MKKFGLIVASLLAVAVLVAPMTVLAGTTTDVTGNVVSGYTFTAPGTISLGDMPPGAAITGTSTGHLTGNNAAGYRVTGVDAKTTNKGCMVVSTNVLSNKLEIGPSASPTSPLTFGPADSAQTFLGTSDVTDADVPCYVSQLVAYTDTVATGYTLTITFTVTASA